MNQADKTKSAKQKSLAIQFTISAPADVQVLPRVLEYFVLRDLTPSWVSAKVDGENIRIVVQHPEIDAQLAELIAEKMRAAVLIEHVDLTTISQQGA
ncbi:MAG: hypothetical protein JWO15_2979 [Sphingomonadales bacterium]|nr:hypothetical protein [Sphingomonadales bacterium]